MKGYASANLLEYEKSIKLGEYFSKAVFGNYSSTIFGKMKYLQGKEAKLYEKLSTLGTVDNFFISKGKIIIPYNSIEQSNEESNSKPKLDPEPKEDPELEGYDAKSIYRQ